MTEKSIPTKYVLFTHYWMTQAADLANFKNGVKVKDLDGLNALVRYFRELRDLLNVPGHEGMLVLFYAPGYAWFLNALARPKGIEGFAQSDDEGALELRFAGETARYLCRRAVEHRVGDRLRFITPLDLNAILGRANMVFAANFSQYFTGATDGIRYDAPKVVEAILRLRLVGTGVPVLRVDQDALFDEEKLEYKVNDLGMFKPVTCAVRAYRLRIEQPAISTFLFSASYESSAVVHPPEDMTTFEAWSRAFATRIFPALIADPEEVKKTTDWDGYAKTHLHIEVARRFYGLKPLTDRLEGDGTEGLIGIGAHPLYSIISGALLCMSDGAILDLPPCSNFRHNVMWIDDFLKYSLHRAMHHFASGETLNIEPSLRNARLDDVTVTKARPSVPKVPGYVFGTYLPTLLLGTIMDAWITIDPILKCRSALLHGPNHDRWVAARDAQHTAPLPRALSEALRVGAFGSSASGPLEQELAAIAVKRIETVRQQWAALRAGDKRTFASYWAAGDVRNAFGVIAADGPWEGIAPGLPLDQPVTAISDLSGKLHDKVRDLIADAVEYVRWTLEWPKFIQMVRSVRQGEFSGDLSWRPAAEPVKSRPARRQQGQRRSPRYSE